MANIRPIYEDASKTTQLYPQTHEKAVIDSNGNILENKLGAITSDIGNLQAAYSALTQSDIVVVADHTAVSSPVANTIYREQGTTTYSDWMYYDSAWKEMATYSILNVEADMVLYDNPLNSFTSDNMQRALDEVRGDDYNLLSALGMLTPINIISSTAAKNVVTEYTYTINKGDRFRVKVDKGSGVTGYSVSTRNGSTTAETIFYNINTNQDIVFEALKDADRFAVYTGGGKVTLNVDIISKDINSDIKNISNCLKETVYGKPQQQNTLQLSFVQGGINADGTTNTLTQRIRTDFIQVKGNFSVTVSTLKFNIYYYTSNDYDTYKRRESVAWMPSGSFNGFHNGYIIIAEAKDDDSNLTPSGGNGTLTYDLLVGGLDQLLGIKESQENLNITFSLGAWNSYTAEFVSSTTRMASPKIKVDGSTLRFKMDSGYKYSMMVWDDNGNVIANTSTGWIESDGQYHELVGLHGYLTINVAKSNDATISTIPDFGFELIYVGNHTSVGRITDFMTKDNKLGFSYTGAPISLQRRNYWMRLHYGYPVISNFTQQGMAVYGDVAILGSSTQSGTNVKAEAFKISDNSKLASMLLPRGGYSDIHSNVMCFGKQIGSGTLPYLYVSQWDNQKGCFVYDIASNYAATLQQTILPTNVSASLIGGGTIDWVVDTDNNRLLSIGYVDTTSYDTPNNGMRVCVFKLPTLSESTVTLADTDVMDSFYIDELYVRQDCCYNNGNIYMLCGAGTNPTSEWNKIAVINIASRSVASVIDLKWLPTEPEGLDVYDNSLFIRLINDRQMFKLRFD